MSPLPLLVERAHGAGSQRPGGGTRWARFRQTGWVALAAFTALTAMFHQPARAESVVIIDGRGFGHGVGLDQEGAFWLAKSGKSADQILQTFYPGTTMGDRGGNVRVPLASASRAVVALPNGGTVAGVKVPAGRSAIVTAKGGLITATVTAETPRDTTITPVPSDSTPTAEPPPSTVAIAPAEIIPASAALNAEDSAPTVQAAPAIAPNSDSDSDPDSDPDTATEQPPSNQPFQVHQVRFIRSQSGNDPTQTTSPSVSAPPAAENPVSTSTVDPGVAPTTVAQQTDPAAEANQNPAGSVTTVDPATATGAPTPSPDSSGANAVVSKSAAINVAPASVLTITAPVGSTVGLGGKRYRGTLEFSASGGSFRVVNDLDVEWYLLGMGEILTPSWPLATLQSQAIVARTYALRTMALVGQVCPTQACQVYLGAQAEYPKMTQAVESTAGKVVTYKGRLAATFYSASGGGVTATPEEGFGGSSNESMPYLRTIAYPTGDVKAWSVQVSLGELGRRVGYRGIPTSVEITRVGPSGRATEISVYGSSGTLKINGPSFDRSLGLKSTYFQFRKANTPQPVGSVTPETLPPTSAPTEADTQTILLAPDPFNGDPASDPLAVGETGASTSTEPPTTLITSTTKPPTTTKTTRATSLSKVNGDQEAALALDAASEPETRSPAKLALGAGSLVVVAASVGALLRFARTPRKPK